MATSSTWIEPISDFEQEAITFLTQYGAGAAAFEPQPIPIEEIAKKMSLRVEDRYALSNNKSVDGAITFADGLMTVYDANGVPIQYPFSSGTIFLDSTSLSCGRKRNTLAHECFHWYKHRDFFLLQLKDSSGSRGIALRCETDRKFNYKKKEKYKAADWAEWQAREIAPKILMPKPAVEAYILTFSKYTQISKETFHVFLKQFVSVFQVSKQSACLRLIDLKCPYAQDYYDENFQIASSEVDVRKFSKADALSLYLNNDVIRDYLISGEYCFTVEGYYAVNDKKYIQKSGREYRLTEYGASHLSECTLLIPACDYKSGDNTSSKVQYRKNLKAERNVADIIWPTVSINRPAPNDTLEKRTALLQEYANRKIAPIESASAELGRYIVDLQWTYETFREATGLSKNRFYEFRNSYLKKSTLQKTTEKQTFLFETYLSVGFGLGLDIETMNNILESTNYSLKRSLPQHRAYEFCFVCCYDWNISQCNIMLHSAGFQPFAESSDN